MPGSVGVEYILSTIVLRTKTIFQKIKALLSGQANQRKLYRVQLS